MFKTSLAYAIGIALMTVCMGASAAEPQPDETLSAADPQTSEAQTPPPKPEESPQEMQAIQVSGYAGSLAKSVANKRAAEVISDTISSEDIGKFPESNMAESLQRITGVQITRSFGEGQYVSVRGLDPKFTAVLYNERELPSPTGSRSFDFSILSADFISALQVFKTPTPEMAEGGLAATINVQTLRPLDYGKQKFAASVDGLYDKNAGETTPKASLIYTDTFLDKTLGWVVAADYSKHDVNQQIYQAYGLQPFVGSRNTPPLDYAQNGNFDTPVQMQNAEGYGENYGSRKRQSLMSMLQFKPNEVFEARLDVLYSQFKSDILEPYYALRQVNMLGPVHASQLDDANNVEYIDADGVDNRNNTRYAQTHDKLKSIGLGTTLSLDAWRLDGDVSYSKADRKYWALGLETLGRASGFYDFREAPGDPASMGYTRGWDAFDPNNYNALGFNGNDGDTTSDTIKQVTVKALRNLQWGVFNTLHVGGSYSERTFATGSRFLNVSAQQIADALGLVYNPNVEGGSFNAGQFMSRYGGSGFFSGYDGSAQFPHSWLSSDPFLFYKFLSLDDLERLSPPTALTTSVSSTREKVGSAFVKLDFDSADSTWGGNFGLRFVNTDQSSTGYAPDLSLITFDQQGAVTRIPNVTLTTVSRSYSEILPSFNFRYSITDDLLARFGAARVMQRPDLSVLAPTTTVNANVRSISQGNPGVDPYIANQYDVSLEWYFNEQSLLSLAFFYKDVKNFIVNTTSPLTLNVQLVQGGGTVPIDFTVSKPDNGSGTKLKGLEFGYQQPFTFLPSPFQGFGAMANYTYIDASKIRVVQSAQPVALSGVSKNSYNAGLYFENTRFGAHLLYNYRSGFVSDPLSYFGDGAFVKSYGQLDFSANYNVTQNVTLTAEILNATDEPYVIVNNIGVNRSYALDGRRYSLGLHVSF